MVGYPFYYVSNTGATSRYTVGPAGLNRFVDQSVSLDSSPAASAEKYSPGFSLSGYTLIYPQLPHQVKPGRPIPSSAGLHWDQIGYAEVGDGYDFTTVTLSRVE